MIYQIEDRFFEKVKYSFFKNYSPTDRYKILFNMGYAVEISTHQDELLILKNIYSSGQIQKLNNCMMLFGLAGAVKGLQYQFFGSKDSIDYDIFVVVDKIPEDIIDCHALIKGLNEYYGSVYTDKKINCNIGTLNTYMGHTVVHNVFKGTEDEVNNSLFYTYANHKQPNTTNFITTAVKRDVELKFKRVARFLLTFFSRDEKLRTEIKFALKSGNFETRLSVIEKIDLTAYADYNFKKNENKEDIWKVIAFQLSQVMLLSTGIEEYTKEGLTKGGLVTNFLYRKELTKRDFECIEYLKKVYCAIGREMIKKMNSLKER